MAADVLGPVILASKSRAGYTLVISDSFTKHAVTVALQDMTAATVANAIIDVQIMNFGVSDVTHTDHGLNFDSEIMQDICRIFMIEKTRTTPYHHQGKGQFERFKESLPTRFQNFVQKNRRSRMCFCVRLLLCITPPFTELTQRRPNP